MEPSPARSGVFQSRRWNRFLDQFRYVGFCYDIFGNNFFTEHTEERFEEKKNTPLLQQAVTVKLALLCPTFTPLLSKPPCPFSRKPPKKLKRGGKFKLVF